MARRTMNGSAAIRAHPFRRLGLVPPDEDPDQEEDQKADDDPIEPVLPRLDDGASPRRVRDSARYLADNDWLEVTVENGRTRIGLGARARKLLEEATAAVT
jgi:hypothetical protein